MKCENCKNYYSEEDGENNKYHYCDIFNCRLCEIAGLNTIKGCELYKEKEQEKCDLI